MNAQDSLKLARRFIGLPLEKRQLFLQALQKEGVDFSRFPIPAGVEAEDRFALSYAQQRMWFLWQLDPASGAYNLPGAVRLKGTLSLSAMQQAFESLVARHETLRTLFQRQADERLVQVAAQPSVVIEQLDLSDLAPTAREQAVNDAATRQSLLPFDLAQGPLLRVQLLKLDAQEHVLLLTLHHIVSDGWSMNVLIDEFIRFYDAHERHEAPQLPDLPIQYSDFALWQRRWLEAGEQARQLEYWQARLGDEHPVLELPTDHPRPAMPSYQGTRHNFAVDAGLAAQLRSCAQQHNVTLFMLLLGAFNVLLHRYTGQGDIRVGVPIANRNRTEVEGLIGFFVNTQVLRTELTGQTRVSELLRGIKEHALGAQAHQELPFERLVEALKVERSLSHTPLFQVMYNHQPVVSDIASISTASGLELALVEWQGRTTQFDLTLDTYEKSGTLHAALTYANDLFDASTIARMARHWISLLQAMVADGEQRIGELPMLSADEQQVLVQAWNQTAQAYPTERGIHHLIEDQVHATPEAPALVFGATTLSYAQLDARANQLAHALREQGVGPDVLVGVCVERSIEMVVGLLAILKAGGAYVPLDPEYPQERLAYMIEDSGIQLLLSQHSLLPLLPVDGIRVIALDSSSQWLDGFSTASPNVAVHALNLAYVIYTSGSTGKPKGAGNSHRALINRLCWMQQAYGLDGGDAVLQKTPFSFDVSVWEFFWPLMTGARLVVAAPGEHREPARLIETIGRHAITTLHFVPSMLQAFIHEPGVQACASLKRIVCSGEALPLDAQIQVFTKLPQAGLFNLYGPTEAAIDVTHWTCVDEGRDAVPIGRPIANLGTYVLDAQLNPVPAGVSGELYLGGTGLARSYHRRAALTAERFVPSPFGDGARLYRTGDRVRQRADGVIDYLGRLDHQVKLRGLRIELGEIETRLMQHPGVREAVVLVQGGKQLVAYLVLEGAAPTDLKAWLLSSLPEYMVPSHMVHLAKLPVTANGKLDRKALPLPDAAPQQAYIAPQNPLQKALAAVWSDVLGVEQVGLDDNFFELGGDSIISIQVVSRARQAGVRLSPRDLFQYQSVRSLALVATFEQAMVIDQGAVTGDVILTPVQQTFFAEAIPARQHWNQSLLLTPRAALEPARLEAALTQLVNHHDALRLRFVQQADGWQQTHAAQVSAAALWQSRAANDTELAALCDEAQRSLDLEHGPLLRAALVSMADGSQRLLLVIHHLVVDGVSWRILLEDLQQAYGGAALPAKTSAYQAWAQQLQAHALTLDGQLPYWQAQSVDADLPCDRPEGGLQNRLGSKLEIRLDAERTRQLLQDAPAAYRTQVNDLLLTALARVISRWSGQPAALIQLEGHGREDLFDNVDLSRTVGWFTSLFPLRLQADGDLSSAIKSVKEQLRAVPDKGIGYGLLRHLGTPAARDGLANLATPRITFNYLGQFDRQFNESTLFVPATQGSGQAQDPEAPLANWLTVEGQVYGGELALQWGFSREMFEASTIQRLADDYVGELQALIAHCIDPQHGGLTPADVSLAQLTQAQLDDLALPARDVQDVYPLSPMQQGMLFHSLYQQGEDDVYVSQLRADVQGVDVAQFQRAWAQVLARHDMLRTGFVWQDDQGQALQVVHRQVSLPFDEFDFRERQDLAAALDSLAAEHHRQGFELARPPLLRVALVRISDERWHLIYTSHHILMDGWSNALVLNEVLQACKGQPLPPAGAAFSQHIAWLQQQDPALGEAFWRQRLAQLDEPTHLARSVAKTASHSGEAYAQILCELDETQTRQLAALARAHQVTLNTLVQSAWLLLLQRYTGQASVACGVTVSGRPAQLANVEQQVGLFINTLPLIATANPAHSVGDWVRSVQALNVEMREHEHTPLFDIQRWAGSAGEALFDTLVVFENFPVAKTLEQPGEGGLRFSGVSHQERTNYPLTLTVHGGEHLSLHLEYQCADFAHDAVQNIAAYLLGLLQRFVEAPEQALGDVPLLLADEHQRVLQDWNPRDVAAPAQASVLQRFERQAAEHPENVALILDQQRLSYAQLNLRANRLAHRLIEQGVGADTLVGVAVDRSLEMIVGLLAVLKAGGAYVPLDPKYPAERLQCMIEDSGLHLLLTQQPLLQQLPITDTLHLICLEDGPDWLDEYSGNNPAPRAWPANLAYVMFTSGSTGRPKGVGIDLASLARHVEVFTELFALQPDDRVLQFGTFNFDGFVEQLYPALCCGAAVVVRGGDLWDSDTFYQQLLAHDISVVDLTTAYWLLLVRDFAELGPRDYGRLRQLHIGGEAMPPEGLSAWRDAGLQHVRLLNTYGPTEATVTATALECAAYVDGREALPTMMPIGRVLDGRAIYLLDANLNPVPVGVAGELVIGGPLLARGYFNRPELTAERFIPDPFSTGGAGRLYRTGDLARYRADGMIEYVGRIDHQVKVRGFRIELGEIETHLLAQAGVREALVIAADSQLVGYVVASQPLSDTQQSELRTRLKTALRAELPDYMVPAHLLLLDHMPLSPNGKLNRGALPKPDASQPLADWRAPVTELEQRVAAIWAQVLGAERVGLDDHFFEMGGHSLLATQLVSRVRHGLGVQVSLKVLFEHPRLADFVLALGTERDSTPALVKVDRAQPLLLSYAQERQWFLWQLDPHSAAYHVPSALRLKGSLDPRALQRAFDALVARHESLRTHLQQEGERTVQVINPQGRIELTAADTDEGGLQARVEALITQPFDLRSGPLMRVSLLRLAEDEHVLVLVQHHIVSDGWSMQVMVDELVQLYAAYSQGHTLQLPDLTIQYVDYALWQRGWMEAGEKARQLGYWRDLLGGEQPVLELPFDRQRPAVPTHRGARLEVPLAAPLLADLKTLAQREGVTLFMLLLASYQVLLHRYSGQQDIRVGVPIANRNRIETERLIGFFVNTQVLKADIDGHTTVHALLAQVKQRALQAQAHQDLPFEQLVEALQPERSLSLSPLFQVAFNHHVSLAGGHLRCLEHLQLSPVGWDETVAQFDLTLDIEESQDQLRASLSYATDLFDAATIAHMARHWQNLLQAMVADQQQLVSQLNLLDADEQQHILQLWNQTDAGFSAQRLVHELVADRARENPQAVAVKFDAQTLTYGELDRQANRLAHALIARGIGPEVRVAIAMPRSAESLVAFLAVLKAGGVYVPLDIEYPRDRLLYMMQDSRAQLLLTHTHALQQLPIPEGMQMLAIDRREEWADHSDSAPHVQLDGDNLAYVIYTSGSTGMPKGVAVSHGPLVAHIIATGERYETSPSDCELHFMSFAFDGSHEGWMHPLINGASVLIRDDSLWLPEYTYAQMHRHNVTMAVFPPVYLQQLAEHAERDGNPPAVRVYCFGGDAVAQASYDLAWRALKPTYLFNGYGPTETVVTPLLWKARRGDPCGAVYAPIGTLLGNRSGYVLDAQLNLQPIGVAGELYLGGEGVARGYLERPALTAERFVPDPFGKPGSRVYRSGDLTRGRADGVVDYLGRVDHQVKIRGFRIELGEIEARLREQDSVGETVVVAQDGPSGKQLVAYVVPASTQINDVEFREALRRALKARLPDYMVPAHFMFLAQMPLTPNGKLDRKGLPQPDASLMQQTYVAPQSELEQKIAGLWADVLRLPRVGLNDNFFELGGDSIISIQVVSRARQAGIRFTPKDLFQHQTVQSLAAVAQTGGEGLVIDQGLVSGEALLLPIHQYFFQEDIAERHHWNQSVVLRPGVRLDGATLSAALLALIEHHDALRLSFSQPSGGWQAQYRGVEAHADLLWERSLETIEALEPLGLQAQRSLDLADGPLLRAVLVELADGSQRLLLVIHHLVVDGVSWRILLEDLQTAYTQLERGQPLVLPAKTSSTQAWAKRLQAHAQSPALQEELRFWQAQLQGADADLPCDNPEGGLHNSLAISVNTHLDQAFTRRLLQEAPAAYRTQINDLLLTALSRVITRWTGADSLLVKLEGHGREDLFDDVDLTRTVGWFTSMYPLALTPAVSLADSIKGIKEQLRAVPDKGIGFGALRYLGDEHAQQVLGGLAQPRITFNYLGQFDGTFEEDAAAAFFTPTGEEAGPEQSAQALLGNWLEINGQVFGGELTLSWSFSREMFSEATVQRLADAYAQELKQLIEHCCVSPHQGVTPSDFPLAALNQAQLDQFALAAVEDVYPLAPLQQGMLFHALYEPQAGDYVNQMRVDVEGLDVPRFRDAWQAALDNHDILRTGFILHGSLEHPLQVVHLHAQLPFIETECLEGEGFAQRLDRLADSQRLQGFDLEQPPLIRIALVHTGPQRCHLIYTSHHILMDGWSSSQLLGEVLERYAGHAPQAQVSRYRDFIAWLQAQDKTLRDAFWTKQLATLEEPTRLFQALPRNKDQDAAGLGEYALELDAAQMARLKAFAQSQKITLNTLVQSAWLLLLQRYTGQDTVAFGATVSGRPAELRGVEQQVGLFINTLPVVASPRPDMLVAHWLQQIQQQNVALREHEHTPLFELQRLAGLGGDALFDTILVFENYPVSEVLEQGAPLGVRFGPVHSREQTHYPLSIAVGVGETLSLHYTYDLGAVDAPTVMRLSQHLLHLLTELVAKPQAVLGQLTLLTAPEQLALMAQGNGVVSSGPGGLVPQQFEQQVRRTPQATAVIFGEQQWSYAALNQRANRLAHGLIQQGVGPDSLVGIALERSFDMLAALLAILKAGGAYVPLDADYPQERLAYMLKDSGVQWLLTQSDLNLPLAEGVQCLSLEGDQAWLNGVDETDPQVAVSGQNLMYVIYTSGTTGNPKGVGVTHAALAQRLAWMQDTYRLQADDVLLQKAPMSFDVSVWECFWPLISGSRLVIAAPGEHRDPVRLMELIQAHGVTTLHFVPSLLQLFMDTPGVAQCSGVRRLFSGGEALTAELRDQILRTLPGVVLHNRYGPTETTINATWWPCSLEDGARSPIGRPLGNVICRVLDGDLNPVPAGIAGELCVGGEGLARGYLGRPGLSAERFVADPFGGAGARLYRTGDRVRWADDGALEYLGRLDQQIKIRGFRVELEEICALLLLQAEVAQAQVILRQGSGGGQLVGYYVAQPSAPDEVEHGQALRAALQAQLPDYMVPKHFVRLSHMPLSPSGKLDRKALPEPGDQLSHGEYVAPHSDLEQQLAAIWADVLDVERVGLNDNFFELGGHSLLVINVMSRIQLELGVKISVHELFQHAQLKQLADHLQGQGSGVSSEKLSFLDSLLDEMEEV